jgi:hypothetical protein
MEVFVILMPELARIHVPVQRITPELYVQLVICFKDYTIQI